MWTDHGQIIRKWPKQPYPLNVTNAIDPAVIVDRNGKGHLNYGSFWQNIWQIELGPGLTKISTPGRPAASAKQISYHQEPATVWHGANLEEGSYVSYHVPYYYLWYAHGRCCGWNKTNINEIPIDQV